MAARAGTAQRQPRLAMAPATGRHLRAAAAALLLLLQLSAGDPASHGETYCLHESISGELSPDGFDATWVGGNKLFHAMDGEMVVTDVRTNQSTVVLPKYILDQYQPEMMSLSPDESYVLLAFNVKKVYRHSTEANYTIYSVKENITLDICSDSLQLARWSPVNSSLAFVYQNNLFYLSQPGGQPLAITTDGIPGRIYNGAADWVYEEEVLSTDSALWWSPDGLRLAYARFDDTRVHNASYMHYGVPGALHDQYAQVVTVRYPKAGTTNPKVQLKVATISDSQLVSVAKLNAPISVVSSDHILYTVTWAGPNKLLASWANRVGNAVQFVSYDVTASGGTVAGEISFMETRRDGWVEVQPAFFRPGNVNTYVTLAWQQQSQDTTSFPQVVTVTGTSARALTTARASVTQIYGWDSRGVVYYQSTETLDTSDSAQPASSSRRTLSSSDAVPSPSRRHVLSVKEDGAPTCLSCNMVTSSGQPCRYSSASFSSDFTWVALTCSAPNDPPVITLLSMQEEAKKWVWKDYVDLRQRLAGKLQLTVVDDWIEVANGVKAQVRMLLPPGLDTSGTEQRPAIVNVYAGPGSQQISDLFTIGFQHYEVTYRRNIYIYIDGRGSNYKGDKVLFSVNRHLGNLEIQDQINVTRQLKQKYPYIDGSRMAIWGWSYGGYATAMTLAKDNNNIFKCGVSVAPVSSWIYYDSIYTERYMGLPTPLDNEAGYNVSDVTHLASRFQNKKYFLIHGTADDNVHYQHSMMLARALEDAGVLFRQQSYPDQDHSMGSLREHLYTSLDEFLQQCFYKENPSPSVSSASKVGGGLLMAKPIAKYVL